MKTIKPYAKMPGIRARRLMKKLPVADAAAALGVEKPTWYDWEKGKYTPTAALLPAMAELLDCEIADLYEDGETRADEGIGPCGEREGEEREDA